MSYDAARQRVVMFGGNAGHAYRDLWAWDGTSWTRLSDDTGPAARDGAVLAFDPASQKVLLWGGRSADGTTRLTDTWEWNGTSWSQATASGVTGYEHSSGGVDPERGRFVVFTTAEQAGAAGKQETWEWDGQPLWTKKASSGATSFMVPLASPLVFLATRHTLVGLVGDALAGPGTQLWEWGGTSWSNLGSGPAINSGGPLVATGANALVAFDGDGSGVGKTYRWNGTTWSQIPGSGPPGPRFAPAMAYDENRQVVVLFGGWTGTAYLADTWEFDGTQWRHIPAP
jgi:hypothetical protein